MECKKCGQIVVDGASFCSNCGERVDGKKPCKACGKPNDENFSFCVYCGKPLGAKKRCVNCGTVYEGNFCPGCGTAAQPKGKALLLKIFEIIGGAFTMLGALAALIFVFFIGLEGVGEYSGLELSETTNIFYFFGDAQKELSELDTTLSGMTQWFANLINNQIGLYTTLGVIVTVATLGAVVAFATMAIVKYILSWVKKTENKANGWALATVGSFLAGAVLFYSLLNLRLEVSSGVESIGVYTKLNGVTVAGIILCAVAVVTGIVFRLIAKGKEFWTGKKIVGFVFTAVSVAFAGVLLGLAQNAGFGMEYATYRGESLELGFGYLAFNFVLDLGLGASVESFGDVYHEVTNYLFQLNSWNVCAQIAGIFTAILAAVTLVFSLRGLTGEKKSYGIIWASGLCLVTIFLLISTLAAQSAMNEILFYMGADALENSFTYPVGVSVAAVVFSFLLLAGEVVRLFVGKEKNTTTLEFI